MAAQAEEIDGRRSFKTHTPADCLPVAADEVAYVAVYRHGPDAFASWVNHRARMRPHALARFNEASAADGCVPWPVYDGDVAGLFEEWQRDCNPVRHLSSWWPLRHQPNVLFVHYADLSADLDGQMRRVAEHLHCHVSDDRWPTVVERCTLDAMRARASRSGELDWVFDGGADAFFHQGGHGRGEQVLDENLAARYSRMTSTLPTDAATWLASGTHASRLRPGPDEA